MFFLLIAALLIAQDPEPAGVALIRHDAEALAPHVTTNLARAFLKAGTTLPPTSSRTLYHDPSKKTYLTELAARRLTAESRDRLTKVLADETFFHNTRYGSPLAYVRPLEILGKAGVETLTDRKLLDFGCGGIGPLRMMASIGADVTGIDVDPMLAVLYSEPGDLGKFKAGNVSLVIGRYPADASIKAKVGGSYDVILAKNTLKRGYVHPESGRVFIDFGMTDEALLETLHAALKPGGHVLIYNLGPAPNPAGAPYKPMADCRCPFSRATWESAGFHVKAFDADDTPAAREMGAILGWDKGSGAMDLKNDLFATYTLVRKP